MANFYKYMAVGFWLLAGMSACQEGGEAGDLLGQWRLTGSDTQYVSFSGSITLFRSINEGQVFGNFRHVGDSLFIQCHSINGAPSDTAIIENTFGFKPFTDIRLKIERLDGDRLVLGQGERHWDFYLY